MKLPFFLLSWYIDRAGKHPQPILRAFLRAVLAEIWWKRQIRGVGHQHKIFKKFKELHKGRIKGKCATMKLPDLSSGITRWTNDKGLSLKENTERKRQELKKFAGKDNFTKYQDPNEFPYTECFSCNYFAMKIQSGYHACLGVKSWVLCGYLLRGARLKKPKQKTELQKLAHEILNEKTKLFDNFKKIKKGKP